MYEFGDDESDIAVFAALGSALAQIQSFELQLATQLGILARIDTQEFWGRTLGTVIREFRTHLPDQALASQLEEVRSRRNHLVHGILRDYGWPMMSTEDYNKLIVEIESTRVLLGKVAIDVSRYLSDKSLMKIVVVSIDLDGSVRREV